MTGKSRVLGVRDEFFRDEEEQAAVTMASILVMRRFNLLNANDPSNSG